MYNTVDIFCSEISKFNTSLLHFMNEIESKILLNKKDLKKIKNLLVFPDFVCQQNKFYSTKNGFLRIRTEGSNSFFTYKGQRQEGKYNSRIEIEVKVDNFDNLEKILDYSGFKKGFSYEKNRASLNLNNCIVSLDSLNNGDFYLEVEGSEENIEKTLGYLSLSDKKIENRSYQEILRGGSD